APNSGPPGATRPGGASSTIDDDPGAARLGPAGDAEARTVCARAARSERRRAGGSSVPHRSAAGLPTGRRPVGPQRSRLFGAQGGQDLSDGLRRAVVAVSYL